MSSSSQYSVTICEQNSLGLCSVSELPTQERFNIFYIFDVCRLSLSLGSPLLTISRYFSG